MTNKYLHDDTEVSCNVWLIVQSFSLAFVAICYLCFPQMPEHTCEHSRLNKTNSVLFQTASRYSKADKNLVAAKHFI